MQVVEHNGAVGTTNHQQVLPTTALAAHTAHSATCCDTRATLPLALTPARCPLPSSRLHRPNTHIRHASNPTHHWLLRDKGVRLCVLLPAEDPQPQLACFVISLLRVAVRWGVCGLSNIARLLQVVSHEAVQVSQCIVIRFNVLHMLRLGCTWVAPIPCPVPSDGVEVCTGACVCR